MSSLPSLVALKNYTYSTNGHYVAIVKEGSRKGCIEISTKDELLVNPIASFVVVPSTDGLVHIRSSYNNKYWRSESESSNLLVAAAEKAVEDKSAWNCTLFKIESSNSKVSLNHAGTNSGVLVKVVDSQRLLQVAESGGGSVEYFEPVDAESIVKLPRMVTFKGDNGKYLRGYWSGSHPYNKFAAETNLEKSAQYEIFYTNNGDVRVKAQHFNKYWRRSPNWIWGDSDDASSDNPDTVFQPVKVGTNVIALRSRGNQKFCQRLTTDGKESCLNAAASDVVAEARLEVEEPVISRKIEVHYRLMDAVIYERIPLVVASYTVPNGTHLPQELTPGMTFTKTQVSTWSNTSSLTLGTKATFSAKIPFTVKGELEVSAEVKDEIQFGRSNDFSKEVKSEYKVTVPPLTKALVKVIATESKYDIPFSYTQTDTYTTGERVTTTLENGVYHGVEAYDFSYEAQYESLQSSTFVLV